MTSISNRFEQQGYATYCTVETLLLKAAKRDDFSQEIKEVAAFYDDDIGMAQLEIFGETSFTDDKIANLNIHNVIKYLQSLQVSQRLLLEQVCRVAR